MIGWSVWQSRNSFPVGYDPYAILGLSSKATDAEVRKAYKRLTLVHHPDKVAPEMKEQAEAKFIEINKAYKVLTDEETRRLFDETGNADGIRNMTVGIALPAWMVSRSNVFWMLAAYGLAFGILLPYVIGRWWNYSKRYTKNKIRFATMSLFYRELREDTALLKGPNALPEIICRAVEFKEESLLVKELQQGDEKALMEALRAVSEFSFTEAEQTAFFSPPVAKNDIARRTLLLLWCHLHRIVIPASMQFVVEKSFHLVAGLFQIATARSWVSTSFTVITFGQMLVQAIADPTLGLLQFPGFNAEGIKQLRQKRPSIKMPWDLKELPAEELRELVEDPMMQEELLLAVARYPRVILVKPQFKVLEHDDIPAGSLVTAFFFIALAMNSEEERQVKKLPLLSDEECEAQINTLSSGRGDFGDSSMPAVHAPYFPGIKFPTWWALLSQSRTGTLQCLPVRITSIPKVVDILQGKGEKGKLLKPSLVLQFNAPTQPGSFALSLELKCDSLLNTDFHCDIKINVAPATSPRHDRMHRQSFATDSDSE